MLSVYAWQVKYTRHKTKFFQPFLSALLGKTKIKKLLSCVFFFNVRK